MTKAAELAKIVDASGNIVTSGTVEPAGDTAAGDNAAIGFTSAEGIVITGQGSTNDVTIKNDADADVIEIPTGTTNVTVAGTLTATGFIIGSADINENDLESIDGITAGTIAASKAAIVDTNKDITGFRNITLTGELDAATLDVSGNADIDGTLEADAMTLNGTAITATATLDTGISNNNVPKFTSGVADDDFLRVNGTAIEGRSASEVLSDIGGQAALTFGISDTNIPIFTSGVADDDFLRVNGTAIEGRSASEVLSDIGASAVAGSSSIVTTGALNSGSITSGFGNIDTGSSTITTTGAITGGTLTGTLQTASQTNITSVGTLTSFRSTGIDDNADALALTIDSSENVTVGATSFNIANNGHGLGGGGNYAYHTATESTALFLNRKTSDGDILRLQKNNSTVGSIGTLSDYLTVGSGDTGLLFNDDTNRIQPWNLTGNTSTDATIDIGLSSQRFKDLYLSGGVFLGGTGSANKLDDYEEGTHTVTLPNVSFNHQGGSMNYTKIGDRVFINGSIQLPSTSDTNEINLSLPFAASGNSIGAGFSNGTSSTIYFITSSVFKIYPSGSFSPKTYASMTTQTIYFGFQYRTTA